MQEREGEILTLIFKGAVHLGTPCGLLFKDEKKKYIISNVTVSFGLSVWDLH